METIVSIRTFIEKMPTEIYCGHLSHIRRLKFLYESIQTTYSSHWFLNFSSWPYNPFTFKVKIKTSFINFFLFIILCEILWYLNSIYMLYINTYIWNLERWYWWSCMQDRKGGTDVKSRLLDSVGKGKGGMICENNIETCTLPYVK